MTLNETAAMQAGSLQLLVDGDGMVVVVVWLVVVGLLVVVALSKQVQNGHSVCRTISVVQSFMLQGIEQLRP